MDEQLNSGVNPQQPKFIIGGQPKKSVNTISSSIDPNKYITLDKQKEIKSLADQKGDDFRKVLDSYRAKGYTLEGFAESQRQVVKNQINQPQENLRTQASQKGSFGGTAEVLMNPIGAGFEAIDTAIQKIPVYKSADNSWIKDFAVNLVPSVLKMASSTTRAVTNPFDTLSGLTQLVGTEEGREGLKNYFVDRYGSLEGLSNYARQDPAGIASDLLTVVSGGASLVGKTAGLAGKGASIAGKLGTAKNLADVAGDLGRIATKADNLSSLGLSPVIQKGIGKVGVAGQNLIDQGGMQNKISGNVLKYGANAVLDPLKNVTGLPGKVSMGIKNVGGKMESNITEPLAEKLMGTKSPQDKLFKAQAPTINYLNRKVDLKTKRSNSDRSNELIVEAGEIPTDTRSRVVAHENAMKKVWGEVEKRIGKNANLTVDLNPIADELQNIVNDVKKSGVVENQGDITKLEKQIKEYRRIGTMDIPTAEKSKQYINGVINNRGDSSIGDVYKNGMKKATAILGQQLDDKLALVPGEFQNLKKDFGALKSTYEDVVKADIKNQKKKGQGFVENYSKIEGLGDILGGALSTFSKGTAGLADVAKGVGKIVLGKGLAKATDADFLIKKGFEELAKKKKPGNKLFIEPPRKQLALPLIDTATVITPEGVVKERIVNAPKKTVKSIIEKPQRKTIDTQALKKDLSNKPITKPSTTKELEPLYKEAKKYKSAEEFIKSKGQPVYHGGKGKIHEFKSGFESSNESNPVSKEGIFFAKNKGIARTYANNSKGVTNAYLDTDKIYTIDYKGKSALMDSVAGTIRKAKEAGYDVVEIKRRNDGVGGTQYVVVNPKIIKTKSQLKQIREEANKK